jgi:PRTRC genetic system protein C
MTIEKMTREFRYDGLRLADPNEQLSVDEVKVAYCTKSQNQNVLASL